MAEHLIVHGGDQYVPFGRSCVAKLKKLGLPYADQKFDMGDATVKVRIEPGHEYIKIEGGGLYAHLVFWLPPVSNQGLGAAFSQPPMPISKPTGTWYTVRVSIPSFKPAVTTELVLDAAATHEIVGFYNWLPVICSQKLTKNPTTYSEMLPGPGQNPPSGGPRPVGYYQDASGEVTEYSDTTRTTKIMHGDKVVHQGSFSEADASVWQTLFKWYSTGGGSWIWGLFDEPPATGFIEGAFSLYFQKAGSFVSTATNYLYSDTTVSPDLTFFYAAQPEVAIRGSMLTFCTISGSLSNASVGIGPYGELIFPPTTEAPIARNKVSLGKPTHAPMATELKIADTKPWTGRTYTGDTPISILNEEVYIPSKEDPKHPPLGKYEVNCPYIALRTDVTKYIPSSITPTHRVQSVCREYMYVWGPEGYKTDGHYGVFDSPRYTRVNYKTGEVNIVQRLEMQPIPDQTRVPQEDKLPDRRTIYFDDYVVIAEGHKTLPFFTMSIFRASDGLLLKKITNEPGEPEDGLSRTEIAGLPAGCYLVNLFRDEASVV